MIHYWFLNLKRAGLRLSVLLLSGFVLVMVLLARAQMRKNPSFANGFLVTAPMTQFVSLVS